jgi:DNA-directed RNA polymerase subunit H
MAEEETGPTVEVFNVLNHDFVPHHEVLSDDERQQVLDTYKVTEDQLPKILVTDPAAKACGARVGDIVKIVRKSRTAGLAIAFRFCVEFA